MRWYEVAGRYLQTVTLGGIIDTPCEFQGKSVLVTGIHGWKRVENAYDPPVTPTDWIIKDDRGWIYVTSKGPELDPIEDIGCPVKVKGTVRVTDEGVPYIEVKRADVRKESKVGFRAYYKINSGGKSSDQYKG